MQLNPFRFCTIITLVIFKADLLTCIGTYDLFDDDAIHIVDSRGGKNINDDENVSIHESYIPVDVINESQQYKPPEHVKPRLLIVDIQNKKSTNFLQYQRDPSNLGDTFTAVTPNLIFKIIDKNQVLWKAKSTSYPYKVFIGDEINFERQIQVYYPYGDNEENEYTLPPQTEIQNTLLEIDIKVKTTDQFVIFKEDPKTGREKFTCKPGYLIYKVYSGLRLMTEATNHMYFDRLVIYRDEFGNKNLQGLFPGQIDEGDPEEPLPEFTPPEADFALLQSEVLDHENHLVYVNLKNKMSTRIVTYEFDFSNNVDVFSTKEPYRFALVMNGKHRAWKYKSGEYPNQVLLFRDENGSPFLRLGFPRAVSKFPKPKLITLDVRNIESNHEFSYEYDPASQTQIFRPKPGFLIDQVMKGTFHIWKCQDFIYPEKVLIYPGENGEPALRLQFPKEVARQPLPRIPDPDPEPIIERVHPSRDKNLIRLPGSGSDSTEIIKARRSKESMRHSLSEPEPIFKPIHPPTSDTRDRFVHLDSDRLIPHVRASRPEFRSRVSVPPRKPESDKETEPPIIEDKRDRIVHLEPERPITKERAPRPEPRSRVSVPPRKPESDKETEPPIIEDKRDRIVHLEPERPITKERASRPEPRSRVSVPPRKPESDKETEPPIIEDKRDRIVHLEPERPITKERASRPEPRSRVSVPPRKPESDKETEPPIIEDKRDRIVHLEPERPITKERASRPEPRSRVSVPPRKPESDKETEPPIIEDKRDRIVHLEPERPITKERASRPEPRSRVSKIKGRPEPRSRVSVPPRKPESDKETEPPIIEDKRDRIVHLEPERPITKERASRPEPRSRVSVPPRKPESDKETEPPIIEDKRVRVLEPQRCSEKATVVPTSYKSSKYAYTKDPARLFLDFTKMTEIFKFDTHVSNHIYTPTTPHIFNKVSILNPHPLATLDIWETETPEEYAYRVEQFGFDHVLIYSNNGNYVMFDRDDNDNWTRYDIPNGRWADLGLKRLEHEVAKFDAEGKVDSKVLLKKLIHLDIAHKLNTYMSGFTKKGNVFTFRPGEGFIISAVIDSSDTYRGQAAPIWDTGDPTQFCERVEHDVTEDMLTLKLLDGSMKTYKRVGKKWLDFMLDHRVDNSKKIPFVLNLSTRNSLATYEFEPANDNKTMVCTVKDGYAIKEVVWMESGYQCFRHDKKVWNTEDPSYFARRVSVMNLGLGEKVVNIDLFNGLQLTFRRSIWGVKWDFMGSKVLRGQ
nr:hypothetical protein MACL_00000622 [Theileria orientalis]